MEKIRVMHYINQFFVGIGGEEKAHVPPGSFKGAVGPGKRLQELLGDSAEIVVTAYCGDDYFSEHILGVLETIIKMAQDHHIGLLVAGPAFASGRHGIACVQVCRAISNSMNLNCVTAMHPDNPGVEIYKQYKDKRIYAFSTTGTAAGMGEALSKIAKFVSNLTAGSTIGSSYKEGYLPRGIRRDEVVSKSGADRAVDMLLDKLAGRPFISEIPIESLERVPGAPRIIDLTKACLTLATSSGVIPKGNPDGFKAHKNVQWRKYSIDKLDTMKNTGWDVLHSGYNNVFMRDNPNYGVPLDVCRQIESEGIFAKLYPYFYTTSGCNASIPNMQRIGREMAADMKAEGIDGVLMVSTWGTDNRSGATIVKEIERGGIPVALMTALPMVGKQIGANRVVTGTKIPHPCGDPNLPSENDRALRREIVKCALSALQTDVEGPTIFVPNVSFTSG